MVVQACDYETTRYIQVYLIQTRSTDGNKLYIRYALLPVAITKAWEKQYLNHLRKAWGQNFAHMHASTFKKSSHYGACSLL